MRDDADFNLNQSSDDNQSHVPESSEEKNIVSQDNNLNVPSNDGKEENDQTENTTDFSAEPTADITVNVASQAELERLKAIQKVKDRKKIGTSFIPPILFFVTTIIAQVAILVSGIFDAETSYGNFMIGLLTSGITYVITLIIAASMYKMNILSPFMVVPQKPKKALLTLVFALGIGYLVQIVLAPISWFLPQYNFDYTLFDNPVTFILFFVNLAILPALFEEWIFRGLLLKYLLPFGKWTAIIISGITFGLMHSSPDQAIFAIVFGIMLGIICVNSGGSIWLTFIIHFLNNAYSFLQMYFSYRYGEESINILYVTIPIYILMAVTVGVLIVTSIKGKKIFFLPAPDETKPPYKAKQIVKFVLTSVSPYIFAAVSIVMIVDTVIFLTNL